MAQRVLILGAAGRDFHNFNVVFRHQPEVEVVAFTAAQIPNITGRVYPRALAGPRYPHGIPIEAEADLGRLVREHQVDVVVFSYSDVSYDHVMGLAAQAQAAGADFWLLGPRRTQLAATRPVIAVCASRTGTGKSQTSRRIVQLLSEMGVRTVVVRHPMPYGDLARQAVQRFATLADLDSAQVTVEEREDYEPHVRAGSVVFAGVDYAAILVAAQAEADVLVWDGGNNDLPFFAPDLHITVVDPQRVADLTRTYPGEVNVRMAHVIVVNKIDTAGWPATEQVYRTVAALNPEATVISAASPIHASDPSRIRGARVLVVEDGPSVTHGGLAYGAGLLAAQRYAAAEIVDPRPYAVGALAQAYVDYPQLGPVLPAMGYGEGQLHDLAESIRRTPADVVLVATPVDLSRIIAIKQPTVRVTYALQEIGEPTLREVLTDFLAQHLADTGVEVTAERRSTG